MASDWVTEHLDPEFVDDDFDPESMVQRVDKRVVAEPATPVNLSTEAPASLSGTIKSPNGFEFIHTIRDFEDDQLIKKVIATILKLDKTYMAMGIQPVTRTNGFTKKEVDPNSPLYCKIHNTMMKDRNNGYPPSHIRKLGDGSWDGCIGGGYKSEANAH